MSDAPLLGAKVRALRRREGITQVDLAERLGVSPSYLNLIENNRRPLPAQLLIKLAQTFKVDLHTFAATDDARLVSELYEAFGDPMFESHGLTNADVRELTSASPNLARAMLTSTRLTRAPATPRRRWRRGSLQGKSSRAASIGHGCHPKR